MDTKVFNKMLLTLVLTIFITQQKVAKPEFKARLGWQNLSAEAPCYERVT